MGGPGAFAAALEASARAAGVVIRTGAAVERIATAGGAVRGAVIAGGEEVTAARVVSGLDPRRTLLGLLEPGVLDVETVTEVGALRGRGNVAIVRLALDRVPRLGGSGAALSARLQTGATLDDLERAYDASKYGRLAERPALEITVPSIADPALAPVRRRVVHVWVQHRAAPPATQRRQRERAKRDLRGEIERAVLGALEEHDPGISSSVVAARRADAERASRAASVSPTVASTTSSRRSIRCSGCARHSAGTSTRRRSPGCSWPAPGRIPAVVRPGSPGGAPRAACSPMPASKADPLADSRRWAGTCAPSREKRPLSRANVEEKGKDSRELLGGFGSAPLPLVARPPTAGTNGARSRDRASVGVRV